MAILPITNVINVTIAPLPSGLTTPNVNSLALFTTETPSNINPYGIYTNAAQVASDYGTNSLTAAYATAIFAQVPNVLSGNGRLVIIPLLSAVSATSAHFVTANISSNLSNLIATTNGNLKVTVDGTVNNLTLNFTGCVTLSDIATVIQNALPNAIVTATTTAISIYSKKVGTGSSMAIAAYSGGGTDLTGASYLNTSAGTTTASANSSGETISAAISRTSGLVQYAGIITNLLLEDAAITTIAATIQAGDYIFLHQICSTADIAGIATTISSDSDTRTRLIFYSISQSSAQLAVAAYAGRAFSTDFTGSNTATTMHLKSLANINPDSGATQTLFTNANTAGCDMYVSISGVPCVISTGGNNYFDNVYADLALKFDLETAGFNYLRQTNTKVPQTEQGMNGLKSAYNGVMQQYVNNGSIAAGSWNSSNTFGDPTIFNNNISTVGYYIYSLPITQQSQTDRNARKAPLCQIAVKRAGAIQYSNVIVIVQN